MPSHDPHLESYNSLSEDRGTAYTIVISSSLNHWPPLYYTVSYTSLNYLPPIYIQKSLSKWGKTDNTGKKELTNGIVRYERPPCYSPLFPSYSLAIPLLFSRYSLTIPLLFPRYSLAIYRYSPLFPAIPSLFTAIPLLFPRPYLLDMYITLYPKMKARNKFILW